MSYKVSIILPVYNASKYILRCLDSLRAQSLTDLEVIFVDDWGTDDSIAIISDYILKYKLETDWHIFRTPSNQGPACARNIGIQKANGEYVAFVDSDDWIESDMMFELYTEAKKYQSDICTSAAIQENCDGSKKILKTPYVGDDLIDIKRRRYLLANYVSYFWTMIFRRDMLLQYDIRFPDSRSSEDSSFLGQCFLVAERISQIDKPFYHYIIYPQSISHRRGLFRGKDKHKSISAMFRFAKINSLYTSYWWVLWWIYFKKVMVMSIVDYIKK